MNSTPIDPLATLPKIPPRKTFVQEAALNASWSTHIYTVPDTPHHIDGLAILTA